MSTGSLRKLGAGSTGRVTEHEQKQLVVKTLYDEENGLPLLNKAAFLHILTSFTIECFVYSVLHVSGEHSRFCRLVSSTAPTPHQVHGFWSFPSLTMTRAPGVPLHELLFGDLNDRRIHGNAAAAARRSILRQILEGVAHLHALGIVWGDGKASNVMVDLGDGTDVEPRVTLIDFNLCKPGTQRMHDEMAKALRAAFPPASGDEAVSNCFESPVCAFPYRSPEANLPVPNGEQTRDAALDMWSVGCMMLDMYLVGWQDSGRRPSNSRAESKRLESPLPGFPFFCGRVPFHCARKRLELAGLDGNKVVQLHCFVQTLRLLGMPTSEYGNLPFPSASIQESALRLEEAMPDADGLRLYTVGGLQPRGVSASRVFQVDREAGFWDEHEHAHASDLFHRLLCYDPRKRITARDALKHPYFHPPPPL